MNGALLLSSRRKTGFGGGGDGKFAFHVIDSSLREPRRTRTLAREVRALQAAAEEYPADELLLLTLESRLPFPEVPTPMRILTAWSWILESESKEEDQ